MEIVGDFVLETGGGIDLPLHELFLEPIAGNLAQILNPKPHQNQKLKRTQKEREKGIEEREREIRLREVCMLGLAYLASGS